jgi:two-component system response regulator FlrC
LSDAALAALKVYAWPGNVRELENVIQRALLLADGDAEIGPEHLALADARAPGAVPAAAAAATGLVDELWEEETRRIVAALNVNHGARQRAAEQLGISDRTLRYKLSKMRAQGVQVPGDRAAQTGELR